MNKRWPIAIRRTTLDRARDAMEQRPHGRHSVRHSMHEATIFALYEAGLLVTPELVEVLDALFEFWKDLDPDTEDPLEMRLYTAHHQLLANHPLPDTDLIDTAVQIYRQENHV